VFCDHIVILCNSVFFLDEKLIVIINYVAKISDYKYFYQSIYIVVITVTINWINVMLSLKHCVLVCVVKNGTFATQIKDNMTPAKLQI